MRRRRAIIAASGIAVLFALVALAVLKPRDQLAEHDPNESKSNDGVTWFPPVADIAPRWSFEVGIKTRWVGVADDGETAFWVEPNKRQNVAGARLVRVGKRIESTVSSVLDVSVECEGGDVAFGLVAVGVYNPTRESRLLVFQAHDLKQVADLPVGSGGSSNIVFAARILSPTRILVGYQMGLWSSSRPLKACLIDLATTSPTRVELADNLPGLRQEQIGGGLHLGASPDSRRVAVARWSNLEKRPVLDVWNVAPLKKLATIKGKGDEPYGLAMAPTFTPDGGGVFYGKWLHHVGADGEIRSESIEYGGEGLEVAGFLAPYGVVGFSAAPSGNSIQSLFVPHRGSVKLYGTGVRTKEGAIRPSMSRDGRYLAVICWRGDAEPLRVDVWRVEDFIVQRTREKVN